MLKEITISQNIVKYNGHNFMEEEDDIAVESALTIILDGTEFATMVCTPSELKELVVGFLASEGVIRVYKDIHSIHIDEEKGFAYVDLVNKHSIQKDFHSKRFIGSCCGKGRQFYFHNDVKTAKTVMTELTVTPEQCRELMIQMQESSSHFQQTGGVHNAALCTKDGIVVARTDIGRHNALDKLFGYCIINRIPLKDKIIAFSGRISSEVLLKAAKIGVGIILSKSAPTNLALDLAEELGITAVGFIRGNGFNVYTHQERIQGIEYNRPSSSVL
ncbi:formate dehydrogenase accessory sulfurtransferase FdhD [Bacillus sp. ISL-40]|uniref:formate dehydrogenase accessory sulfurtransferase FdhD n=1 Tax=unclassified Bacillus (in: firmicutes) TaxID=185979 RepID=UPI001BE7AC56|nr:MULTISPECIES: formate dehydrogenase accessory sulfurtransferase FdhD [unclassified Bacillus (in: firmicutes)]MBT2698777.1 formate dehydrogenase accessory sulfurtransferase FdhD [Bacillus sp. ISL-40]MBT2720777.1 formate dehydrogenase accessory sulfurtransferase FdhD [Bacillus sp. ISL-46]MBT2740943.1 formate dehydrogenase accessory sulfurtransferase FdhD [Bacillus sp. ISL-77]